MAIIQSLRDNFALEAKPKEELDFFKDGKLTVSQLGLMALSGNFNGISALATHALSLNGNGPQSKEAKNRKEEEARFIIFAQAQAQRLAEIGRSIDINNQRIQKIRDELDELAKAKKEIKEQYERDGYVRLDKKQIANLHRYGVDTGMVLQGNIEGGFAQSERQRRTEQAELEERNLRLSEERNDIFENIIHRSKTMNIEERNNTLEVLQKESDTITIKTMEKILLEGKKPEILSDAKMELDTSPAYSIDKFSLN